MLRIKILGSIIAKNACKHVQILLEHNTIYAKEDTIS